MKQRLIMLYQLGAGLCDTGTGLLLIFAPAWTLHLMSVSSPPTPIAFASFIGAFVLSVGLTYLFVLSLWPLLQGNTAPWKTQWQLTAIVRTAIALVLAAEIALGRLETAWAVVAITDGGLAAVQWFGLGRGWFRSAEHHAR